LGFDYQPSEGCIKSPQREEPMRRLTVVAILFFVPALYPAGRAQEPVRKALHLGGGKKFAMKAAPTSPAATGEVIVGRDKNGNTKIDLKVDHMAQPDRLKPPKNVYVVWIQSPQGSGPENKGELNVNGGVKASVKTVTPYRNFEIFITAEDNAQTTAPSGPEVLRASVQS
jgi:hypothetical protein